jgi:hypothetical protein
MQAKTRMGIGIGLTCFAVIMLFAAYFYPYFTLNKPWPYEEMSHETNEAGRLVSASGPVPRSTISPGTISLLLGTILLAGLVFLMIRKEPLALEVSLTCGFFVFLLVLTYIMSLDMGDSGRRIILAYHGWSESVASAASVGIGTYLSLFGGVAVMLAAMFREPPDSFAPSRRREKVLTITVPTGASLIVLGSFLVWHIPRGTIQQFDFSRLKDLETNAIVLILGLFILIAEFFRHRWRREMKPDLIAMTSCFALLLAIYFLVYARHSNDMKLPLYLFLAGSCAGVAGGIVFMAGRRRVGVGVAEAAPGQTAIEVRSRGVVFAGIMVLLASVMIFISYLYPFFREFPMYGGSQLMSSPLPLLSPGSIFLVPGVILTAGAMFMIVRGTGMRLEFSLVLPFFATLAVLPFIINWGMAYWRWSIIGIYEPGLRFYDAYVMVGIYMAFFGGIIAMLATIPGSSESPGGRGSGKERTRTLLSLAGSLTLIAASLILFVRPSRALVIDSPSCVKQWQLGLAILILGLLVLAVEFVNRGLGRNTRVNVALITSCITLLLGLLLVLTHRSYYPPTLKAPFILLLAGSTIGIAGSIVGLRLQRIREKGGGGEPA